MSIERSHDAVCVIVLRYVVSLDEVDAKMKEHVAWLEQGYAQGIFIASGRQVPRTGGVILSRGHRADVEALIATDPFVASGAAEAKVIEFTASMAAHGFATLSA